jgi:hypothetical protein
MMILLPHDNTTRPGWDGYEEVLVNVLSQYRLVILCGGVPGFDLLASGIHMVVKYWSYFVTQNI